MCQDGADVHTTFTRAVCNARVPLQWEYFRSLRDAFYYGVTFYQRTQRPARSGSWCTYVQKNGKFVDFATTHRPRTRRTRGARRASRPPRRTTPRAARCVVVHTTQQAAETTTTQTLHIPPPMKSRRGRPRARRAQGLISPAQGHGIRARACAQRARCVLAHGTRRQARRGGRRATRARPGVRDRAVEMRARV